MKTCLIAVLVGFGLASPAMADLVNTAQGSYRDSGGTTYSATSNTVTVTVTAPPSSSPCDANNDGSTNVSDVQSCVNQAIGVASCTTDVNSDGICNIVDVQRVVNVVLGGSCETN